ncbi:AAA family ATPase [Candidatus Uabimicrobium sp. HlEnr_7]|uniref:AAA family ATPase n=1 Tax=Candidatus Uabimicrobium helgolandensis TaxID=3095367 RepID=UPI00355721F0
MQQSSTVQRSNYIVISGCSGGGKSSLIAALAQRNFSVMPEPGRLIVKEQMKKNSTALPWINIQQFRNLALAKSIENFRNASNQLTFFDRSIIDSIPASGSHNKFYNAAHKFRYNSNVFFAPPWPEIYKNDAERKHSLEEAISEFDHLVDIYKKYNYRITFLPRISIVSRVEFVLQRIPSY